jgi:ABC-2 type transport system permease protein
METETEKAYVEETSSAQYSALRAWLYLVRLCIQRQARLRQMVGIALALLLLMATMVTLNTFAGRWGMAKWWWRWYAPQTSSQTGSGEFPPPSKPDVPPRVLTLTYGETAELLRKEPLIGRWSANTAAAAGVQDSVALSFENALERSPFFFFSNWVVFSVFVGFLLPIWSLSFATEALGGDREGGNLIWLLSRPLSRPAIYIAKFVALAPWTLALNVGGFGLLCVLAGAPGREAFKLYWPAVLAATFAFCALFHLMGAFFRRAAVVALVYSFFLETILGTMPGYMKRMSIAFYTRCLMFDAARDLGVEPEKPSIYLPVDSTTAWCVLLGLTVVLLGVGMVVFSRSEYRDLN